MLKENKKLRKFFTSDEVIIVVIASLPIMVISAWILSNFNLNHGDFIVEIFGAYSIILGFMIYFIDYFEDGVH